MSAVADIFDRDGDGYIDYYEFVAALHPNKDAYKPITDADKIEDEVLIICPLPTKISVFCQDIMCNSYNHFIYFHFSSCVKVLRIPLCNINIKVNISSLFLAGDKAGS